MGGLVVIAVGRLRVATTVGAMLLPPLLLVAMVVIAGTGDRTGRPGAVLLAAVSVLWLLDNHGFEGKILWTVSPTHGLTAGDLVGFAGGLVAVWRWFEGGRRRNRG